jgi:hypothetical protein
MQLRAVSSKEIAHVTDGVDVMAAIHVAATVNVNEPGRSHAGEWDALRRTAGGSSPAGRPERKGDE